MHDRGGGGSVLGQICEIPKNPRTINQNPDQSQGMPPTKKPLATSNVKDLSSECHHSTDWNRGPLILQELHVKSLAKSFCSVLKSFKTHYVLSWYCRPKLENRKNRKII